MITLLRVIVGSLFLLNCSDLFAKGDNEIGAGLSYFDRQTTEDGESVRISEFSISGLYLRNFKSFWAGGELKYVSYRSTSLDSGFILFGAPFKYWLKGPESKGIGFYVGSTPYFGKRDNSDGAGSFLGIKLGPGVVFFLNDMLGIDTNIYYDYRRIGSTAETTTGLTSGFSVYF